MAVRRRLLSFKSTPVIHELVIYADTPYTGKSFLCTAKYDGQQVNGAWSITSGINYASINENGKVTIISGTVQQSITVSCSYESLTATKNIVISYDNQLTIEGPDTITGTSGNVVAKYNEIVASPTWSITSGNDYATIDSTGALTITGSGTITVQAVYRNLTTTKNITLVYQSNVETNTEVNDDGSVTTTTTTTTTDPETGTTTETSTSTTTNTDGSTSNTVSETTTNQDGSSSSTSTTTNQDGSSSTSTSSTSAPDPQTGATTTETTSVEYDENGQQTSTTESETTTNTDGSSSTSSTTTNTDGSSSSTESTTSAPDPETGSVTTESETTNYDENGDVTGSSDSTTTVNTDGSSTSQTNNYNENGDPTTTTNNEVDTGGNSSTQDIEYDSNGNPVVTGYTIDTTNSAGDGKQIEDGVNTEYYAFDVTRGFILDIDFIIDFKHQPANQDENHHNILTAKRTTPSPWYGFHIRQTGTNNYVQLGTQFATGSNVNTTLNPVTMTNYVAEYILRIVYDPTAAVNNFVCTDMRTGNTVFTATNTFPDIPDLKYLKVVLGYAMDANGDPYRYSNINVQNFQITKLASIYAPVISCTGRQVSITCEEVGATIYYRRNQSGNFVPYTIPFTINADTIVEAYAELNGLRSITVSQNCIYTGLQAPIISCDGEVITLTCNTQNASIYYKLDHIGNYIVYNAPIQMVADTFIETYSELGGDTSEVISATCVYDPIHDYSEDYLTFRVLSSGTIAWQAFGSGYTKTISYSINDSAWTSITAAKTNPPTILVNVDDVVRFKGSNTTYAGSKANYDGFEGGTATFDIEGNIMSLIYGDNFVGNTTLSSTYAFCSIFKKSNVISAKNLVLPATSLTNYCYRAMFSLCPSLNTPPALPATTLANGCYWYMFEACPISEAPDLEALTLVNECYGYMFNGCSLLNYIRCIANAGLGSSQCLSGWVSGVASTGTFVKDANTTWATGNSGIPTGWTVYNDGEEPQPQDGVWTYANQPITLPYSINAIDGHSSGYAKGTYQFSTSFTAEALQPTYLWFDHADQSAEIYVNNVLVTTHWGGYNSFTVDITNNVRLGSNKLKVIINNTTRNTLAPAAGDFNFNATLGEVELITSPILPLTNYGYDGFRITSSVTAATATINVTTAIPVSGTVVCTIDDGTYHWTDTETDSGEITFTTTIANPHLWDGKSDPHLYNVTLQIYDGQDLCFEETRPYGLRFFDYVWNDSTVIQGETYTGFLLNGHPYYLRGVCMHQDIDQKANALTTTDINNDFTVIQELGCNFIRTAHYPHPRYFYDKCDQLGIVVQTEAPWVNKAQSTMPSDYYTHLESQIVDMVTQHYNHPSIFFWGLANEITTDDAAFAKTKIEGYRSLIRTYDTSRMVGYVVSHSYANGLGVFNDPNVDYIGQNLYVGWYIDQNTNNPSSRINTCLTNANNHNKPMALSEYGCGGTSRCHSDEFLTTTTRGNNPRHDIEYQMWLHEGHIAAIKNYPQLLFTAQWVLFDFAVTSRQEGYTVCLDGENTSTDESLKRLNNKGLLERDHTTKKDTFYLYKAWWNPTSKFVHICGKNYTKKTDRIIKCYTNDGDLAYLYVNGTLTETSAVADNIAVFTGHTFSAGDVIRVAAQTASDTFTF